jgi:hypothetical protein
MPAKFCDECSGLLKLHDEIETGGGRFWYCTNPRCPEYWDQEPDEEADETEDETEDED